VTWKIKLKSDECPYRFTTRCYILQDGNEQVISFTHEAGKGIESLRLTKGYAPCSKKNCPLKKEKGK
jgi:hypothetical protein